MKQSLALLIIVVIVLGSIFSPGAAAQTNQETVVQAVLFYSPTCPHCHEVINNLLIPMMEQYGDRLQVLGVNVSEDQGQELYQLTIEHYNIPPTRTGVPTLVINDEVLVGSGEIPDQFPDIVEVGLENSGISWPGIPGLAEAMNAEAESRPQENAASTAKPADETDGTESSVAESSGQAAAQENSAGEEAAPVDTVANQALPTIEPDEPDPAELASSEVPAENASVMAISEESVPAMETAAPPPPDVVGITLAGLVLGAMLFALGFTIKNIFNNSDHLLRLSQISTGAAKGWAIPVLSLIGLVVATYLAYVEITHTEAVCGPVGRCNEVQSSPYAQIMGIPIAILGMLNYVVILVLWATYRFSRGSVADWLLLGLLALAFAGTLFSVYLTVLEIFVIQAVCMWCISSAIVTTAIMLIIATSIQISTIRQQPQPA